MVGDQLLLLPPSPYVKQLHTSACLSHMSLACTRPAGSLWELDGTGTHRARRQACTAHKHLVADVLYSEVVTIQVAVLPSVESQTFASLLLEGYSNSLPLKGGSTSPQTSPVLSQALP